MSFLFFELVKKKETFENLKSFDIFSLWIALSQLNKKKGKLRAIITSLFKFQARSGKGNDVERLICFCFDNLDLEFTWKIHRIPVVLSMKGKLKREERRWRGLLLKNINIEKSLKKLLFFCFEQKINVFLLKCS